MYLVLMLFQLLCYCWHGNEVQLVSGEIASNVFDIDWIVMNESVKNSLLLIMMRSQRPNFFTAGKFSLLSLQTFMTVSTPPSDEKQNSALYFSRLYEAPLRISCF